MTNENLSGRLKAFSFLLKYTHDLFEAENFADAAMNAVNNSRLLLNFSASSLFQFCEGKAELIAQYGTAEINPHARLAVVQKNFLESHKITEEPILFMENLPEEMATNDTVYLAFSLTPPKRSANSGYTFIWLLGYTKEIPAFATNTAKLIGNAMADALYYHKLQHDSKWVKVQYHTKKRWIWIALTLLVLFAMFLRVPEKANAEFTLKAPQITAAYAWFDGPIAQCLKQDGEWVHAGEVIAEYETEQLRYRLNMAKSALRESEAELAVEEQNAFIDSSKLGQVELLKAKCDSLRIAVDEAQWYLEHAQVQATADGVLALTDGRAELLTGKAVRTGDKLFEVLGGQGVIAEIMVNERDASVLSQDMQIQLFLYNAPETAISAVILDVSHYPEMTEQRMYCYKIRAALPQQPREVRLGMRGIAKISGPKVSLGYFLFKSVVLYVRGI